MDKVDKDRDGSVTTEELKDWIRRVAERYCFRSLQSCHVLTLWYFEDM